MKESVLDVLMYLFDHYIEQDHDYRPDQDALRFHLQEAGFEDRQVSKAFDGSRICPHRKTSRIPSDW